MATGWNSLNVSGDAPHGEKVTWNLIEGQARLSGQLRCQGSVRGTKRAVR